MNTTRRHQAAAVLALVTATAGATGWAMAAEDVPPPTAESCESPRDDAAALPSALRDGSRLFLSKYRSFLVQVDRCGTVSLVEPTGWDSCYGLSDDEVFRYPC